MPIWGRRKKETQEALSSTKKLIIKVKKKGINTSQAEKIYKEAKKAFKERNYKKALEEIEEAERAAKKAYAKGIKERLRLRILNLNKRVREMQAKNLENPEIEKSLKKAKKSLKGGIKEYKRGLKSAKEGLRIAEDKLEKYKNIADLLTSSASMIRRVEDHSPEIISLKEYKEKLNELENLKSQGKIEPILKDAKKFEKNIKNFRERHSKAYKSIKAFEKVVKDAEVLGANVSFTEELEQTKNLLNESQFENAIEMAENSRKELSDFLNQYRDAKHHLDLAMEAVSDAMNWGFSAFEAKKALDQAKNSLNTHKFEEAIAFSKESREKASTIRERHKSSLELIRTAKDEMKILKEQGMDISEIEDVIKQAEDEFYKGDYGPVTEKVKDIIKQMKDKE